MLDTVLIIIIIYVLFTFVVARLFIPHLGFRSEALPEKIPADMERVIDDLKNKAKTKADFLTLSYEYLGSKYRSERLNTIFKFNYLFRNLAEIWQEKGFIPCGQSNFLLRIFLVKSGFFKEEEIKRKHVFVNFVPHQYLQVEINNKWIDVDVGEKHRGMKIGQHLKWFG